MHLNRLATWQKLVLFALPCILLAAVPAALHLRTLNAAAARDVKGATGARSVKSTLEVIRLTQQHRGLSNGVLSGNAALVSQREAKKADVLTAIEAMATATPAPLADGSRELAKAFADLAAAVDARAIPVPESFRRHTELIARMLVHLERWVEHYELPLVNEPVNHFLVEAAYGSLPTLTEAAGQARAHGTAMLTTRTPTARDRLFAASLYERAAERLAAARSAISKVSELAPALGPGLRPPLERADVETRGVIELAQRELIGASELSFNAAEYFARTTRAIDAQFLLLDAAAGALASRLQEQANAAVRLRDAMLVGALALLACVAAFAVAITRAITRPLSSAVTVAGRIASGQLDNGIDPAGDDEVARLLAALGDMQGRLVEVVGRIQRSSDSIGEAARQTAVANADLSSRTEEQASTLEQTAANMEELTATVRANAASASSAIDLAAQAAAHARQGGELVARVVATMGSIEESSRRVAEITETIDGIAFQTNLLALNAAVEAARAGEHGRGFAVVATEVRTLARRCAEAARQIRGLLDESRSKVEAGRREADVAGEAVARIVASVETVSGQVGDIAQASAQQRMGIEQVNQAVTQMDSVTQQNAALVEEAAANALSLEHQAAELAAAVAVFELGEDAVAAAREYGSPQRGAKLVRRTSLIAAPAIRPSTIS
jgi:methyl-accepting chemotaxis protein